jgi:hypothetical protein
MALAQSFTPPFAVAQSIKRSRKLRCDSYPIPSRLALGKKIASLYYDNSEKFSTLNHPVFRLPGDFAAFSGLKFLKKSPWPRIAIREEGDTVGQCVGNKPNNAEKINWFAGN